MGPTVRFPLPNVAGEGSVKLILEAEDNALSSTYTLAYKKRGAAISSREMNRG